MKVKIVKQLNKLTNEELCRAQLVDIESMSLSDYSAEAATEGSTHSESDIIGVHTLDKNVIPAMLAKGYKIDLGIGILKPSVSGSKTKSTWYNSLVKGYMADGLTEAAAKAKANTKTFSSSDLKTNELTAGVTFVPNETFLNAYQVLANKSWKRVNSGVVDEETNDTTTEDSGNNRTEV